MTSDSAYFRGQTRGALHATASSADATVNGVAVLAAVAGATLYAMGFAFHNASVGALTLTLTEGAGAGGSAAIGMPIVVGAGATVTVNYNIPLSADAANSSIGVVASGAGQVELEVWGYKALPRT